MLTARDAVEDRISGLDSGADDYLMKPFSFLELLARLRALFVAPTNCAVRNCDRRSGTGHARPAGAFVRVRPIVVTAKEYALLEYLARNAGRIIGREEIAEHVWDESFDPFSNLIEVYVNRLRKKIDPACDGATACTPNAGRVTRSESENAPTSPGKAHQTNGYAQNALPRWRETTMFNSVRVRLTVYYAAALTLILILVVAFATYALLKHEIRRGPTQISAELSDSFLATVQAEIRDESQTESMSDAVNEAITEHTIQGILVRRFRLEWRSDPFVTRSLSEIPERTAFHSSRVFHSRIVSAIARECRHTRSRTSNIVRGYGRYRGYSRQVLARRGRLHPRGSVFAARNLMNFSNRSVKHSRLIIPLGILLASVGGYFLARNALAPVVSMSRRHLSLTRRICSDRLTVVNPRDELGVLAVSFNEFARPSRRVDRAAAPIHGGRFARIADACGDFARRGGRCALAERPSHALSIANR